MIMEERILINELAQGKELANQLRDQLKHSSSQETTRFLVAEILSSYEKAISLLNSSGFLVHENKPATHRSPRSESSDVDSKNGFKKRKISSEKMIEKVKFCIGTTQEGSLEDGYYWRKYGQKDILGSKNPRGYFRCTHRFAQGCLATKQVQRSDTDPSVFEVTYLGRHTCNVVVPATSFLPSQPTSANNVSIEEIKDNKLCQDEGFQEKKLRISQETVTLNNADVMESKKAIFRTFSFSTMEVENAWTKNDTMFILENDVMEDFSGRVISPATSGSGVTCEVRSSTPASVTNSPITTNGDFGISSLDFSLDLDTNFSLDSYLELLS